MTWIEKTADALSSNPLALTMGAAVFTACLHVDGSFILVAMVVTYLMYSMFEGRTENCDIATTQAACRAVQANNCEGIQTVFENDPEWVALKGAICRGDTSVRRSRLLGSYDLASPRCAFSDCDGTCISNIQAIQSRIETFDCMSENWAFDEASPYAQFAASFVNSVAPPTMSYPFFLSVVGIVVVILFFFLSKRLAKLVRSFVRRSM